MNINIDYYTNYEDKDNINKYDEFIKNYEEKITKIVKIALENEKMQFKEVYVGLGIVTREEIRVRNLEYRNIDKETDVLSFPMYSVEELKTLEKKARDMEIMLGDIVICMDVVIAHSEEYNTGFNREMMYMITHGICHLLGYDHEIEEEKRKMRVLEEKILRAVNGE